MVAAGYLTGDSTDHGKGVVHQSGSREFNWSTLVVDQFSGSGGVVMRPVGAWMMVEILTAIALIFFCLGRGQGIAAIIKETFHGRAQLSRARRSDPELPPPTPGSVR